jgi:hypothetical protein
MITAAAVLAGFLFAALILVLEVGLSLSDDAAEHAHDRGLQRRYRLLREVRANVAYTAVFAMITAGFLGIADLLADPPLDVGGLPTYPVWFIAVAVALLSHLFLTVVMVVKRLYLILGTEADERRLRGLELDKS